MSKHITVSHTSNFKGENVFEKSDQISYSCKAGNPHTSIFKVENIFEKSDQISYSCKAEIHIYQFSKWKKFLINLIKSHTPVKLKSSLVAKKIQRQKDFIGTIKGKKNYQSTISRRSIKGEEILFQLLYIRFVIFSPFLFRVWFVGGPPILDF